MIIALFPDAVSKNRISQRWTLPARVAQAMCLALMTTALTATAWAQHPARNPPSGFAVTRSTDTEFTFERKLTNGDRLRWNVKTVAAKTAATDLAKSMIETTDKIRDESKQDISVGKLAGVAFSCLGASESVEGVGFTRYRRVAGYLIDGGSAFGLRVDLLASEARPAQSTLDANAASLTQWQKALGGVSDDTPPSTSESRPALGGDRIESLTGGGDLEIAVPAWWGRAALQYPDGSDEVFLGPATATVRALTVETIGKEKDALGPFISVLRVRRETFKDLIDSQIVDIASGLIADYVKSRADAGIVLRMGDRTEGTLGTRVVVSAPFEETRASSTKHSGRMVFMLHQGVLTVVTASHPAEGLEAGWPTIAKAFDTLLFVGAESAPPAAPETAPSTSVEGGSAPSAPTITVFSPTRSPADWVRDGRLLIPWSTPVSIPMPAGHVAFGAVDDNAAASLIIVSPKAEFAGDSLSSNIKIQRIAFVEALAGDGAIDRLGSLVQAMLMDEAMTNGLALEIDRAEEGLVAALRGARITYTLRAGSRTARGQIGALVNLGTVLTVDVRTNADDRDRAGVATPNLIDQLSFDPRVAFTTESLGSYIYKVPQGWKVDSDVNRGSGRDIFLTAPSGVSARFQTAIQRRGELVDNALLQRISKGFLADGLKVLSPREAEDARRNIVAGARASLRFESRGEVQTTAFAHVRGDHLIFSILGVPKNYNGRDVALAWAALKSLESPGDITLSADSLPLKDGKVTSRVAYSRPGLDMFRADGHMKAPTTRRLVLLPDGTAGLVTEVDGRREDLRGTYRIESSQLFLDFPVKGRMRYRVTDIEETLSGNEAGDVLWRARHEESL